MNAINTTNASATTTSTTSAAAKAAIIDMIDSGNVAAVVVIDTQSKPYSPEEIARTVLEEMEMGEPQGELDEPATAVQEELDEFYMDEQFRPMDADMIAENVLRMFAPIREGANFPMDMFHRLLAKYAVSGGFLVVESRSENGVFDKHSVSPVDSGSIELWRDWTTYSPAFNHIASGGDVSPAKWVNGAIELRSNMGRVTHVIRVGQL